MPPPPCTNRVNKLTTRISYFKQFEKKDIKTNYKSFFKNVINKNKLDFRCGKGTTNPADQHQPFPIIPEVVTHIKEYKLMNFLSSVKIQTEFMGSLGIAPSRHCTHLQKLDLRSPGAGFITNISTKGIN